jgi:penicillin-insensitive murein endopeptidase
MRHCENSIGENRIPIGSAFIIALSLLLGTPFSTIALADEPPSQVIGYYSNGKLQNSSLLPFEGSGFIHLFHDRSRQYGSLGLIDIIQSAAQSFLEWDPTTERLQIGDISSQHGGQISGHASHQHGLDIDLVYYRRNRREQSLSHVSGFDENFVTPKGAVTQNFDTDRNWKFLSLLVETGRVERIFVDPAIKREFCRHSRKASLEEAQTDPAKPTEMLRRLRPYANHQDHWHVRFTCPAASPECIPQNPPVPEGDGCDAVTMAEFSAEWFEGFED